MWKLSPSLYIEMLGYQNNSCLQVKHLLGPGIKLDFQNNSFCLPSLCFFPFTHPPVHDLLLSPTSMCLGKLLHVLIGQQSATSLE